jgi:hypothetical protein
VNASAWMEAGRTGWEVVHHAGNGGVLSGVSKRDPVVDIHDCGVISVEDRPVAFHCCCVNRVARESMDALVEERRARRRLAVRHPG